MNISETIYSNIDTRIDEYSKGKILMEVIIAVNNLSKKYNISSIKVVDDILHSSIFGKIFHPQSELSYLDIIKPVSHDEIEQWYNKEVISSK